MIRLDTTVRSLTLFLGGAHATAPLQIVVSYSDQTSSTYLGGTQLSNSNGTSTVTICSAPSASTIRDIDMVSVLNTDTATQTVTIQLLSTATSYKITTVTLLIGEKLTYTHGSAWQVVSNSGNIKYTVLATTGVDSFSGGSTGLTPATATTGAVTLSGTLAVANGGTGTASPSLIAGTNVTITGSWPNQTINSSTSGTVTSVSGTTGRVTSTGGTTPIIDLASGVATPGTTGSATLVPVVTIDTYGRVTSITTAANPQGTVTSVTGTTPIVSSGGTTPAISIPAATTSVNGYLTSTDWTTFNNKGSGSVTSVAATVPSLLSVSGSPITTSGTLAFTYSGTALPVANGGTGLTTTPANGNLDIGNGTGFTRSTLTAGSGITVTNASGSITIAATNSGTVTSVTGTSPVVSSGGATPAISMAAATTSVSGYLTSTDWNTFNNKGSGTVTSVSGTIGNITSTGGATPVIDLASGIATAGTTGSASLVPVVTIDTYGRVTSITTAANPQGTVTSVTGTSPIASSGGATPALSLSASYGDTQNPYASKTANYVLAAPNGTAGVPTFRAIVAADIPTLNQNTTGTASNVTGTVAIANGGTGATTAAAALTNLGAYPASNPSGYGTGSVTSVAATVPAFLSIAGSPITTSGTLAISYSGTALPIANGGSGATTAQTAMNAFAGAVTSGSYLRGNGTNVVMATIQAADVPTLNQNTSGSAGSVANALTSGTGISFSSGTTYNGSAAITINNSLPMVYPGAGIPNSTGTAWGTSYSTTGSGTVVALATSPSFTTPVLGTPTSGNFSTGSFTWPTFNQNTTGTAANVTGTVAIANGGTGQTTAAAGFNALSPITSIGDLILGNGTNSATRLGIGANGYVLTSNGTTASWAAGGGGGGGSVTISNDTTTASALYPAFFAATSGTATTAYTSNAKLLYQPSTGEFLASVLNASNGIYVNSNTVSTSYTIPTGSTGFSYGPMSVSSGATVTVSSGSVWIIN